MDPESTRVIFITTDPVLEAAYKLRLEIDEYEITWSNPTSALDAVTMVRPDLIYVDMDSRGGQLSLVEGIRNRAAANIPLILITRSPEELLRNSLPMSAEPVFVVSLAHPMAACI